MGKNYQIPLCKDCWEINYSRNEVECFFFSRHISRPYTKETAKKPTIDYNKNSCCHFEKRKSNRTLTGIKEYQILLCRKCKYMDWDKTKKCVFFLKHGGLTPEKAKQLRVDYEKNTCMHFKSTKSMEGVSLGSGFNPRCAVSGRGFLDNIAKRDSKRRHADRMNSYNHGYGYVDS